jgi:hypothetical protein
MSQDNYILENLSEDDVISINEKLYKAKNLKDSLKVFFEEQPSKGYSTGASYLSEKLNSLGITTYYSTIISLFTKGLDSEVLKSSTGGWKKGKLKFKLVIEFAFEAEETEKNKLPEYQSPLDEIRREIAGYNQ